MATPKLCGDIVTVFELSSICPLIYPLAACPPRHGPPRRALHVQSPGSSHRRPVRSCAFDLHSCCCNAPLYLSSLSPFPVRYVPLLASPYRALPRWSSHDVLLL